MEIWLTYGFVFGIMSPVNRMYRRTHKEVIMTLEQMRERKKELGYTNEIIAQISGVPLGTVQKVFAGITKTPRRETLLALERVFSPGSDEQYSYIIKKKTHTGILRETALAYKAKISDGSCTSSSETQLSTMADGL